ncbi:unnamed protein product [Calypogeia fissa]
MDMKRKAILLLALACTVGSLGLLVTMPGVSAKDSTPLSFAKKTIASNSIVIFSKSYCPYCKRAKYVFKELEETPFVVELDQREDGAQIQDALYELVKRRTVPQVFIDGEHIGGSDDTMEAHRNGRLKKLLGSKQSGAWQHDVS